MNPRRLKIEADGDTWRKKPKPKIRLMGRWLEQAGFPPGQHVEVSIPKTGEMVLRLAETPPESASTLPPPGQSSNH